MEELILVKLGGGLITDKKKAFKAKPKIIESLAKAIANTKLQNPKMNIVIGVGTGSYGHYPVMKYKLQNGIQNKNQLKGFSIVESGVNNLNSMVVDELIKQGVAAVGLHPSSMMVSSNKKVEHVFLNPLIGMLSLGLIPVIHGDMIFDSKNGSHIASTETLFTLIFNETPNNGYRVSKIIYTTPEKGVLDKYGEVIPTINENNYKNFETDISGSYGYDVTGGMKFKVKSAMALAKEGAVVHIIDGRKGVNLEKALSGQDVGTKIG